MPSPIVVSNKVRPHTWSFEKKNPRKALSSTTGPSMWYFILLLTSTGSWNAQVYSSATCWRQRRQKYDFCYSPKWDSSMLQIVCKHQTTYISYPKTSTSASSTTILFLVPLFTHIQCNLRHFCFNPTIIKFIWIKHIFFYQTFLCIIFYQFFRLTSIWCHWGSTSPILEYLCSRSYLINPTKRVWFYSRAWIT